MINAIISEIASTFQGFCSGYFPCSQMLENVEDVKPTVEELVEELKQPVEELREPVEELIPRCEKMEPLDATGMLVLDSLYG